MPWMCGQLQVLRLDFKIGELVRHLAVNVTMPFHLLHPRPLQKQKAYHWRIFTPANNQTIWPLQWWIITPAFSVSPPMESGSFGTLSMSNPEFLQMIRKAHLKYKK